MRRFIFLLTLYLGGLGTVFPQATPTTASEWGRLAARQNEKKEYDQAVRSATECIKLEQNFACFGVRAMAYLAKGNLDSALADANQSDKLRPNSQVLLLTRANIHRARGSFGLALNDLNKAVELGSGNSQVWKARGDLYAEMYEAGDELDTNKIDSAIADYSKALSILPDQESVLANRGKMFNVNGYFDPKSFSNALADLNDAIRLNPNMAEFWHWRSKAHFGLKKDDLAVADVSQAIKLDPRYAGAYSTRATYLCLQKKSELCMADYNKAIEIAPDLADAYYGRGSRYSDLKKFDLAVKDYSMAIQLKPKSSHFYAARAAAYCAMAKKDLANADARESERLGGLLWIPCR